MTMAISEMLIEQNNATVAFLQAKDASSALESSILALTNSSRIYDEQQISTYQTRGGILDEFMLFSATDNESVNAASGTFIYEHAVIIPTTIEIDSTMLITILIFNAALAHHEMAERSFCHPDTRMRLLRRAKNLYEIAYESCDLEQNLLFQFALINNIAVIEQDIGNVSTANQCFEYLMSLLIVFVDQGYEIQLQHVKGFVANVPLAIKNAPAA
ncbi:unnamed protein product [Cylindrotheca closterium]|uniref:Uncharacterized protein n=1 Tax=Cylindrotheca closterium TaxID=2856 RepID=A0AAD2PUK5_9STRA|nr:unnamed protein product [Cylindrotheca closterium]